MTVGVPFAIPRWQWRTFGPDLSWLTCRLSAPPSVESRRISQTHLVCLHSAHHAWLHDGRLELRWRKEVGGEGFELWDTILRADAPFQAVHLEQLFAAWGVAAPSQWSQELDVATFLGGPIAETPSVRPVEVVRDSQNVMLDGIACCLETISAEPSILLQSFAVEHEDPELLQHLLDDLGLHDRVNTSFLQGLRQGLGLPQHENGRHVWARKSNASTW